MKGMIKHTIPGLGTVYFSTRPTARDKKGCDGLYVKKVVVTQAAIKAAIARN